MDRLSSVVPSEPGLILQHGTDGPPGRLAQWLQARAIPYEVHRADQAPPPPDVVRRPWIASLGSERSATAPAPSWPADEVAALRRAADAGVPVLGLCFGGQALSLALGGAVRPSDPVEIGWIPVEPTDGVVPRGPWFQWHFELLEVPPGAVELARSPAGPAAFRHRAAPGHAVPSRGHAGDRAPAGRSWPATGCPASPPTSSTARPRSTAATRSASRPSRCSTPGGRCATTAPERRRTAGQPPRIVSSSRWPVAMCASIAARAAVAVTRLDRLHDGQVARRASSPARPARAARR